MEEPRGHFIYKCCKEFACEKETNITKNFSDGRALQARAYGTRDRHKTWLIDSDNLMGPQSNRDQVIAHKLEEQNYYNDWQGQKAVGWSGTRRKRYQKIGDKKTHVNRIIVVGWKCEDFCVTR